MKFKKKQYYLVTKGICLVSKEGYYLTRCDDEVRIDLTSLNEDELKELAFYFGIPFQKRHEFLTSNIYNYFVESPCQDAAKEWSKDHPLLSKRECETIPVMSIKDLSYLRIKKII